MKIDRKQVKSELHDFNSWMSGNSGHGGQLMADTSDGSVWAVLHFDCNSWTTYHSDTIINVLQEMRMDGIYNSDYDTVVAFLEALPADSTASEF